MGRWSLARAPPETSMSDGGVPSRPRMGSPCPGRPTTKRGSRVRMRGYVRAIEMAGPRTTRGAVSRAHRIVAGSVAAFVLACLPGVALSSSATTDDQLKESKQELHHTKDKVRTQLRRIRKLQRRMNGLATRISKTESDIVAAEQRVDKLERRMLIMQVRASLLQAKLDERSREAYMFGGAPVLYLLTATSAAEAASRMSFLTEMNRRDAVLAAKVRQTTDRRGAHRGRGRPRPSGDRAHEAAPRARPEGAGPDDGRIQAARRRAARPRRADPVRDLDDPPLLGVPGGRPGRDRRRLRHHGPPSTEAGRRSHPPGQRHARAHGCADRRAVRRRGRRGVEPHRGDGGRGVRRVRLRVQRTPVGVRAARNGGGGRRDRLRRARRATRAARTTISSGIRTTAARSTRTSSCSWSATPAPFPTSSVSRRQRSGLGATDEAWSPAPAAAPKVAPSAVARAGR